MDGLELEFLGACFLWMMNGFREKLSDHYSKGSGTKQVTNFLLGMLVIIFIGIALVIVLQN